jgi:hypothetical protein
MPLGHYMSNVPARIIGPRFDPDAGGFTQGPVGTGFFVRVPSERLVGTFHGYLITAYHVIEREGEYEVEIANPDEPGRLYAPIAMLEWKQPIARLDLALAAFDPPDHYVVTAFEANFNLLPQLPIEAMLGAPIVLRRTSGTPGSTDGAIGNARGS